MTKKIFCRLPVYCLPRGATPQGGAEVERPERGGILYRTAAKKNGGAVRFSIFVVVT